MPALSSIIRLRKLLVGGEAINTHRSPVQGLGIESLLPTACPVLHLRQPSKGRVPCSHLLAPAAEAVLTGLWNGGHWPASGLWGLRKAASSSFSPLPGKHCKLPREASVATLSGSPSIVFLVSWTGISWPCQDLDLLSIFIRLKGYYE